MQPWLVQDGPNRVFQELGVGQVGIILRIAVDFAMLAGLAAWMHGLNAKEPTPEPTTSGDLETEPEWQPLPAEPAEPATSPGTVPPETLSETVTVEQPPTQPVSEHPDLEQPVDYPQEPKDQSRGPY